ncbi:hypothetical protein ACQ7FX_10655 [Arthrobacter koreensis]|uniref:hypothetical protein n=1 Tax=Arthrobacter koreensis TaxID=199136 RepID=UPI003D910979
MEERNRTIVRLYGEGVAGTELSERYDLTRQRIDQILKANGAIQAGAARTVRSARRAQRFDTAVSELVREYGETLRTLANAGATRAEVESKFAYLTPGISNALLREAITSSGAVFNVNREEYNFNQTVIEAGIWFMIARENELESDVLTALTSVSLKEMTDVADALEDLGVSSEQIRDVLVSIAAARRRVATDPSLTIAKKRYDEHRGAAIRDLGLSTGRSSRAWPPTSQTVMKRLGDGYWTDALASVGITASDRGRNRGLILFEEADYARAILSFFKHCQATNASRSFAAFQNWVDNEDRLGRQQPSGAAVRLFYGSWTNAKRSVSAGSPMPPTTNDLATGAPSVARTALHDASGSRRVKLEELRRVPATDQAEVLMSFVKDFMGVFEARRRVWFRAVVNSDPGAARRRLAATPALKVPLQQLLEATPPRVDDVLTDMYIDRLLGGATGMGSTASWLADDVQAELDSIQVSDLAAAKVMRELRNFYTHDSDESQSRLTQAMLELAQHDKRFQTGRPLTRRFVSRWLLNEDATRIAVLSDSILAAWRAMLAAEAVTAA